MDRLQVSYAQHDYRKAEAEYKAAKEYLEHLGRARASFEEDSVNASLTVKGRRRAIDKAADLYRIEQRALAELEAAEKKMQEAKAELERVRRS